ncbi:MAG: hypothetical protein GX110_04245, partial [Synergistaceae bacterium]|nr:hypothetical protein [Synergistaceae bacterium]
MARIDDNLLEDQLSGKQNPACGEAGSVTERYFRWDPLDDPDFAHLIVGTGSIGGKGRSLLFAMAKIRDSDVETLKKVIFPPSLFIATDSFDYVLNQIPDLEELKKEDPEVIEYAFVQAKLPTEVSAAVRSFLEKVTDPIVVRSSSVLEDSLKYSFAGKYLSTFEFNGGDSPLEERAALVEQDIKKIYARTFFPVAIAYRQKHGLGDDRMGIIIMRVA